MTPHVGTWGASVQHRRPQAGPGQCWGLWAVTLVEPGLLCSTGVTRGPDFLHCLFVPIMFSLGLLFFPNSKEVNWYSFPLHFSVFVTLPTPTSSLFRIYGQGIIFLCSAPVTKFQVPSNLKLYNMTFRIFTLLISMVSFICYLFAI